MKMYKFGTPLTKYNLSKINVTVNLYKYITMLFNTLNLHHSYSYVVRYNSNLLYLIFMLHRS